MSPILCLSPLGNHSGRILLQEQVTPDLEWCSPEACVAAVNRAKTRIVWLGHAEPLLHPEIGKVVASLLQSGCFVFVHTSGAGLRKRIHEFQPNARLFLAIEVPNDENATHPGLAQDGIFRYFREALDGARLSGFYRCAHVTVDEYTDAAKTALWLEWLNSNGVEGLVASLGSAPEITADPATLIKLAEIRNLIPSGGWRKFSRILEESRRPLHQPDRTAPSRADREPLRPNNDMCEENAVTQ